SCPFARRRHFPAQGGEFFVLGDAAAQRLHEIDHPARRGNRRLALLYDAGLFGLQTRKQRLLVTVPKAHGIEISDFDIDNVPASVSMSGAMVRSGRSQK